jgi:hypothetical protein
MAQIQFKTPKLYWIESPYVIAGLSTHAALRYASYCMSHIYQTYEDCVVIAPHLCYGSLPIEPLESVGDREDALATSWHPMKKHSVYRDFNGVRNTADHVFFFIDLGNSSGMKQSWESNLCRENSSQCRVPRLLANLEKKTHKDCIDMELIAYLRSIPSDFA